MIEFAAASGPRLMLDEASVLDIGGCIVEGVDIAPKRAIPDDGDPRIDHSLEGFLFTCGPDHIRHRQPIAGSAEGKVYPLHGSASGHAERLHDEAAGGNLGGGDGDDGKLGENIDQRRKHHRKKHQREPCRHLGG